MTRLAVLAAALAGSVAFAQAPETDADSPAAHRRALEGLATAKPLSIAGPVLDIVSATLEIKGASLGVEGLLKDLNAEVRDREVRIALSADVLFDFDRADLRKEAVPELEKVATVLREYPNAKARIDGHTDGKGESAYNQKLSERRAETVRKWFEKQGVTTRMSSKGWGKTRPVAPNSMPDGKDDPEGRRKNRRVEVILER